MASDPLERSDAPQAPEGEAHADDPRLPATLAHLLRRMRQQTDFPAMSESIVRVQTLAGSETESVHGLTNEILKDVALTQKLLRLVNSAQYAQAGGGISTVSRAVSLIGFAGIRNLALSLLLLEHMQDKAHARELRTEFLRAQLAATLASEWCGHDREGEEAFIGALFQNLGRMLAGFYLPDEARQIREAVVGGQAEDSAARRVLRLDFETLGLGVARAWSLPGPIQRLMIRPVGKPPARVPAEAGERLRWLVLAANDMADTVLACDDGVLPTRLLRVAQANAACLGVPASVLAESVYVAREHLAETASLLGLGVPADSPAARLIRRLPAPLPEVAGAAPEASSPNSPDKGPDSVLAGLALEAEAAPVVVADPDQTQALRSSGLLTTGIQDVTQALLESVPLNDVLRMVLETMYRALGFQRVLLCLRDPTSPQLLGRMGLGADGMDVARRFRIGLGGERDLFALVCSRGADTLISDASAANVAQRLPAWYREQVNAPSFLLLPLLLKGAPLGLIYADMAHAGGLVLNEQQLSLLKTLRSQAVMAFRQAKS
jgi:HD-like signal output (HDOD) protein